MLNIEREKKITTIKFQTETLPADAYPDNVGFQNGLAISYTKLGLHFEAGDRTKAIGYYEMARDIWTELTQNFPAYVEFARNLAWVSRKLDELR